MIKNYYTINQKAFVKDLYKKVKHLCVPESFNCIPYFDYKINFAKLQQTHTFSSKDYFVVKSWFQRFLT